MANEVGELLRSWDIPDDIIGTFESKERVMHKLFDIKGFFLENQITLDHFGDLTESLLKELCPVIAYRIELARRIQEYLIERDQNVTIDLIFFIISNETIDIKIYE